MCAVLRHVLSVLMEAGEDLRFDVDMSTENQCASSIAKVIQCGLENEIIQASGEVRICFCLPSSRDRYID
jgi:hypothetical protein